MKEAQRKYRASPRGKATRTKCDAAYYQDKKKKDALCYNIMREEKAMRAMKAGDPCGHRPGLALDDAVLALQTPQAKGDELVDDPQVLAQSNVAQWLLCLPTGPMRQLEWGKNTGLVGGSPAPPGVQMTDFRK